jgi:uncharacterized protein
VSATYLPEGIVTPVADTLDGPFHEGLLAHHLVVPHCAHCGTWQWPPEVICHHCHQFDVAWTEVEPSGVVFSWTRVWHPLRPPLAPIVPYLAVLVELPHAGGIRLIGNLLGPGDQEVHVGDRVRGTFEDHDGDRPFTLLQWARTSRG